MKRVVRLSVLAFVLAVLLALGPSAAAAPDQQGVDRAPVLIGFTHQPGPAEEALVRRAGGDVRFTYHIVPAIAASLPEQAIDGLSHNPNVSVIEPDIEVFVVDAELDNTWGINRIGAGIVHDAGNQGIGVTVGVLDTGIDTDHPDLSYDPTCSVSFVPGEALEDGHGHGTHTAGTVHALDNGVGVVGGAPASRLCVYKVLANSGSGYYSYMIAALEQALADGVMITNNSYGSSGNPGTLVQQAFDTTYAAGMLHIAAAGNAGNNGGGGSNCIYPARWDSLVAVGATTQSDTRASFSSTCDELELAAPGYQIPSTMIGGGYADWSGTSMATPHGVSAGALVWSVYPGWTNDQVRTQLQATADDLGDPGRDAWYGYGLVDAAEAAGVVAPPPPPENSPPSADFSHTTDGFTVYFTDQSSDTDGSVVAWSWDFGDGNGSTEQNPIHTYSAEGTYTVALLVTDDRGGTDSATKTVTVSEPPTGFVLSATGYKVKGLQKADLSWSGATAASIDVYRDGVMTATVADTGAYTDNIDQRGQGSYIFQVCDAGTNSCSNEVTVNSFN